jgi:hypothetical protein
VTAVPTADQVDGYSVELIAATKTAAGQAQQGIRTPASVTKATFTGLDLAETYTVEVRSTAAGHMSDPGVSSPLPDTTPPTINDPSPAGGASAATATTAPNGVTLSGTGQIYYTLDSSSPINGDVPSDTAKLYSAPIPVTGPTEIRAMSLDQAGNHSREVQAFYKVADATTPPPASVPAAPTGVTATGGVHQAVVNWTAGPASVTSYKVYAYKSGATVASSTTTATTNKATVNGLTAGATYTFAVTALNTAGDESAKSDPSAATLVTDSVSITKVTWKVGDFRVTGAGSDAVTPTGTVTLFNATTGAEIVRDVTVTNAAAPATGTTFDIRLRAGAATTAAGKPAKVYVKSSLGGRSADVVVP